MVSPGEELLEAIMLRRNNEKPALAGRLLIGALRPSLRGYVARTWPGASDDAFDDLVADVRLRIWTHASSFRGNTPGQAVAWAQQIAHNLLIDRRRKGHREVPVEDPGADLRGDARDADSFRALRQILARVLLRAGKKRRTIEIAIAARVGAAEPGVPKDASYYADRSRGTKNLIEVAAGLVPPLDLDEGLLLMTFLGLPPRDTRGADDRSEEAPPERLASDEENER